MANAPYKRSFHLPLPSTILRVSAVTFFAAAFLCGLLSRGQVGLSRELAGFFILPVFLFLLFFLEYKIVETMAKVTLNLRLGHVQAFGCLVIVLYGLLQILSSAMMGSRSGAVSDYTFLVLAIFGEAVFLGNVVLSYLESTGVELPRPPALQPLLQPKQQPHRVKLPNRTWPRSPALSFGFSAAFFAGLGLLLKFVRPFAIELPFRWQGQLLHVPFGNLWMLAALPFASFALIYWGIEFFAGRQFDLSATRIHLVCTLLAVIETARVYSSWAMSLPSHQGMGDPVTAANFGGVFAFGVLAAGTFAWNLWTSRSQTLEKRPVR